MAKMGEKMGKFASAVAYAIGGERWMCSAQAPETLKEGAAMVQGHATPVQEHLFEMAVECDRLAKTIEADVDRLRDELYEYSRRLAARGALEWATQCPATNRIEEKRTQLHTLAQQVERLFPPAFENKKSLGSCLAALSRLA